LDVITAALPYAACPCVNARALAERSDASPCHAADPDAVRWSLWGALQRASLDLQPDLQPAETNHALINAKERVSWHLALDHKLAWFELRSNPPDPYALLQAALARAAR